MIYIYKKERQPNECPVSRSWLVVCLVNKCGKAKKLIVIFSVQYTIVSADFNLMNNKDYLLDHEHRRNVGTIR